MEAEPCYANLDIDVQIQSYTKWHISEIMKGLQNEKKWLITSLCGYLKVMKRESNWFLLKNLKPSNILSWFCFGDFNEVTYQSEKVGVGLKPHKQMEKFQKQLNSII